ncbi:MAG: GHKL domain-containing protein [Holosporaceae bacterium]|jgi:signal transduction histidine kinase|nr:GHKL domain-containing protein [Holosporaceae bacterium]
MSTSKCVKWSKEAKDFFESAAENSVVLDIIISYECVSQSGEGLEELVNSINSENIKRKIKSISILDTSYLYRHIIPVFSRYSDPDIPTAWFSENKHILEKLTVDTVFKSWATEVSADAFKSWFRQIMIDYAGDEHGNGIVQEFRDLVIADAAVAAYKGDCDFESCINFMLEKCAHACANFCGTINLVYPMKISSPVANLAKRYPMNINYLRYRASVQTWYNANRLSIDSEAIDREVTLFMKERESNVNFFVIDKYGNHIYKNYAYTNIVGNTNFGRLDPQSWKTSIEVMNTKKQIIVEEKYQENSYLSVKAPLIINDNVEGIIGLAIDITDRKKAEEQELQNKLQAVKISEQEKFNAFITRIAHDAVSPLTCLKAIVHSCDTLPIKQCAILKDAINSISSITCALLNRYKQNQKNKYLQQEQHILVYLALSEVVSQKTYQYQDKKIVFKYLADPSVMFTFIRCDPLNFNHMISNLINNSVEAIGDNSGTIEVTLKVEDKLIKICVKDNGCGMSPHIVEKIINQSPISTVKTSEYGTGLEQVYNTLKLYGGNLLVESEEKTGTAITVTFPLTECPNWIADKIVLPKNNTIVILDDDDSIHRVWTTLLKEHSNDLTLKFFTDGKQAIDFIESFHQKNKIFLIADYDLRSDISGLQVILESGMKERSLIVTGIYNDKIMLEAIESSGLKMFPKQFLSDVSILVPT